MFAELFPAGEYSRRFDDDVDVEFTPRQFERFLFMEHAGSTMRRDQIITFEPQGALKATHYGVIIQQVTQRVVIEDVVDRNQFGVCALIQNTKHGTADSTESVNGNLHFSPPMPSRRL